MRFGSIVVASVRGFTTVRSRQVNVGFLCLAMGLLVAAAVGSTATAGPPGRWSTVVAGANAPSVSAELGIARTADGRLHVAWRNGDTTVRTRAVSPAGQLGSPATIVSGWSLGGDPTLLAAGSQLRAFFSAGTPVEGLLSSIAPQAGAPWSSPALVVNAEVVRARTIGATTVAGGVPLQTWYTGGDIAVHRGTAPSRVYTFGFPGSDARPNVATDTQTGAVLTTWCNFGGPGGVYVRRVDPASGAPVAAPVKLPGSTTAYQGAAHATCVLESTVSRREPLAARAGGGFYVAGTAGYPNRDRVLVWRLDSSGALRSTLLATRARQATHSDPAIAAAPDGRIWVAWLRTGRNGWMIVARRSNRAGTAFGAPVTAPRPPGGIVNGTVNLSAQGDRVDVLAVLAAVGTGAKSVRHTQLYPGLTLVRQGIVRRPRGAAAVTFDVLDAGEPVPGARVRAGGRSGTTNGAGRVTLLLRNGPVRARASKPQYVAAAVRFRCCR